MSPLWWAWLACLPADLDPEQVETPYQSAPPAPASAEPAKARPSKSVNLRRGSQSLAYAVRGKVPVLVRIEGDEVVIDKVRWERHGKEAAILWWKLPAPFAEGVVPDAVTVDGVPCPLDGVAEPGHCDLKDGSLVVASPGPKDRPTGLRLRVPAALAAREAELRGARSVAIAASPATIEVDGVDGPLICVQEAAAAVGITRAPETTTLSFRPLSLDSVIFGGEFDRQLTVAVKARDADERELWSGPISADAELVQVHVDDWPAGARLIFRASRDPAALYNQVSVVADAELAAGHSKP